MSNPESSLVVMIMDESVPGEAPDTSSERRKAHKHKVGVRITNWASKHSLYLNVACVDTMFPMLVVRSESNDVLSRLSEAILAGEIKGAYGPELDLKFGPP
jgi:hypothetical protein